MTSVMTNGHVAWLAGPDSAITDAHWVSGPTLAEVQSLENHSESVKVDGTDWNVEASEQVDDRSFADQAGAQARGPIQASGSIEIYTPGRGDETSAIAEGYETFTHPRTRLALGQRFVKRQSLPIAAGDEINLFRVITDDRQHNRNDASRTAGVGLVLQDNALINYIVPAAVPTQVAVTPAGPITLAVGEALFLEALYQGRNVTVGAEYISGDESLLKASPQGILIGVAEGTTTLIVNIPGGAAGTPIAVTVEP